MNLTNALFTNMKNVFRKCHVGVIKNCFGSQDDVQVKEVKDKNGSNS